MLLLDEPLSALDEFLRIQMRQELRRMQRDLGITFVHVTHSQLEAIALADLVVVMDRRNPPGRRRRRSMTPRAIGMWRSFSAARTCSAAGSVGERPSRRMAQPAGSGIQMKLIGVGRLSTGDTIFVAVRRDDIELVRPGDDVTAGRLR